MIPWLDEFRESLGREFAGKPMVGSIATVDVLGRPRVRSVVCRGVGDDGSILFASDSRSGKNAQIRGRPDVEVCFWLATLRLQFRIAGVAAILGTEDGRRASTWRGLSDPARALFSWPEPGGARVEDAEASPKFVGIEAPIAGNFEVIEVRPDRVDRLDLTPHPHDRRRWSASEGWAAEAINA